MSENAMQTIGVSKFVPQGTRIFVIPSLVRYQFGRSLDILSLLFRSQNVEPQMPIEAMHALMRLEALSTLDRAGSDDSWTRIELAWTDETVAFSLIIDSAATTVESLYKALEAKPKDILEATRYLSELSVQKSGIGTRGTLEISATLSRKDSLASALDRAIDDTKLKLEAIVERELETISPKHEYQALPSVENLMPKSDPSAPKRPSMADALVAAVKISADKQEEEQVTVVSGSYEEDEEEEIRIAGSKQDDEPEKVVRFKSSPKKKKEKAVKVGGSSAPGEETETSTVVEEVVQESSDDEVEETEFEEAVTVVSSGPSVSELNSSITRVRKAKAHKSKPASSAVPSPSNSAAEILEFFKGLLSQDEAIAALEKWFNERIARAIVKKTVTIDQIEQLLGRVTKNPELTKQLIEIIHALPADDESEGKSDAEAEEFVANIATNGPSNLSVARLEKALAEKEKAVEFFQKKVKELEERLSSKVPDSPEDSYFKKRMQELETELNQSKVGQREAEAAIRKRELEIQQAESRLARKFEEAENRAKMAERLLASNAETAVQAAQAQNELVNTQSKLDQGIDRVQSSMQEARNQIADEKAKAIIDSALGELNAQKAELNERSRSMANEMKKQEFQFNSKVALIQEELRQTKLASEQKDAQIERMKELVNRVQEKYEAERANATRINNEATQMKMAAEQFRRQFEEAQKELERIKKRAETEAAEKQNNAGGGQLGQLNKQLADANKNLLAKKQEVEQLKRQLNEKTAAEVELKKQLTKLQGQQSAGAAGQTGAKKLKAG